MPHTVGPSPMSLETKRAILGAEWLPRETTIDLTGGVEVSEFTVPDDRARRTLALLRMPDGRYYVTAHDPEHVLVQVWFVKM